jgi:hypothetical protein
MFTYAKNSLIDFDCQVRSVSFPRRSAYLSDRQLYVYNGVGEGR